MRTKIINEVIEMKIHDNGILEVRVHPFSRDAIGLYEEGMRKALKEKDENACRSVYFDFSEENRLRELDEKAMFDILQFMSFNCLRQKEVSVHWGQCFLEYLKKYSLEKNMTWKLSASTVKKLVDANCECMSR